MRRIGRLANPVIRFLVAPACASCGATLDHPLSSPVCARCWHAIRPLTPPWCDRCGDALEADIWPECARCRADPPAFTCARSAGAFDGPLREMIHAFKFEGRRQLAGTLGVMMRRAGAEVLEGADAAVPVPLHPWRSLRRGFNQADDLARHVGLPVWRALRRRAVRPPQAGLSRSARHDNLREAFALSARFALEQRVIAPRLRGRTVVLIDDVLTTGATLDACARVLLDAGATTVRALTAARALAGPPPRQPRPPSPSPPRHR